MSEINQTGTGTVIFFALAFAGMFTLIGYQGYLNFFVYTDDNPTRHDVRIRESAEAGYAHDQYLMGTFLASGRQGIQPDIVEARRWFEKAAEQGHPEARYRLGDLHRRGEGVAKDSARAMELFQQAATGGSRAAEDAIGDMYRHGEGVDEDVGVALEWYRRAAEHGFAPAQRHLGVMAVKGEGMERDYSAAYAWYQKAAAQGDEIALNNLGIMFEHGQGVSPDPVRAWACYFSAALGHYKPAGDHLDAIGKQLSAEQLKLARSAACVDY